MILILSGLPGGGKSTYAREWLAESPLTRTRINYDDLRFEMFGPDWTFNRADEAKMKAKARASAEAAITAGMDVIIDNTNLTEAARQPWIDLAHRWAVPFELYEIDTPVEECVARDRQRIVRCVCGAPMDTKDACFQHMIDHPEWSLVRPRSERVGRAVIERMALFNGWIDWTDVRYANKPFIICDVDGTLADGTHRQHHVTTHHTEPTCRGKEYVWVAGHCSSCGVAKPSKNWKAFHDEVSADTLIEPIARLLKNLTEGAEGPRYNILIVSGRWIGDRCGKDTEDWLDWYGIPYSHLFMRNTGDSRPDFEVKREILELLPIDRIAYVLDDRDQVVKMWREAGLTCLQVREGNF